MNRLVITTLLLLAIILAGCVSDAHIIKWDHVPYVGWRAHQDGFCNLDCFDEQGNVLLACQSCYDANKRLLPGCIPGYYGDANEACSKWYWREEDAKKRAQCVANWPKNITPLH